MSPPHLLGSSEYPPLSLGMSGMPAPTTGAFPVSQFRSLPFIPTLRMRPQTSQEAAWAGLGELPQGPSVGEGRWRAGNHTWTSGRPGNPMPATQVGLRPPSPKPGAPVTVPEGTCAGPPASWAPRTWTAGIHPNGTWASGRGTPAPASPARPSQPLLHTAPHPPFLPGDCWLGWGWLCPGFLPSSSDTRACAEPPPSSPPPGPHTGLTGQQP